jgi:predicted dehydrogenase
MNKGDLMEPLINPEEKRPIVIIGAGSIVNDAHLPAYKLAGFEVGGIFDLDKEKAELTAEKFGVPVVCDSLADLVNLAHEKKCVYDMALPASAIISTLQQLPNDIGILIQKPMGENLEDARQILQICREKGLTAGVNFQLRHAPNIVEARKMVDAGRIGEVHDFEVRVNVFTPWNNWKFLFDIPRVEIVYHSIHYIDLVRSFMGDPESVYAKTVKHPKMAELASTKSSIILDYGDMKRALISTNHGHEFGPEKQESFVKIEGTEGAIKMRMGVLLNYPKGLPDTFEYSIISEGEGWQTLDVKGNWFVEAFPGPMAGLMKKVNNPDYAYINSVEDAIHTMEAVEASHLSSDRGGTKLSEI